MSRQEGTPKKVPRLERTDSDPSGSNRSSAPPSPFRPADYRNAPSTPSRHVDNRSAPPSPFRPADRAAPSTPSRHADNRSAPPSPFRPADRTAPSTPPTFFEHRSTPSSPFRLADSGTAPVRHASSGSTPPSPFLPDYRTAPSTPVRYDDNRSAPHSPFGPISNTPPFIRKLFDYSSAPSSPLRLADKTTPPTPPRPADSRSEPSSPFGPAGASSTSSRHFDFRSAPSPAKLSDHGSTPPSPFRQSYRNVLSTPPRYQPEDNLATHDFKLCPAPPGKFAYLKSATSEPSPLPVIDEDVVMEDADKPGPSQVSPTKKALLSLTKSPKSPIAKWLTELGAGLNSLSNRMLGCVKQSETETYEWVCSFRYRPFAGGEKWLGQVYRDQAAHRTHLLGAAIPDILCFEVSTRKLKNLPADVLQSLGACVTFPSQLFSACRAPGCSRCNLYNCSACPHQYLCDCDAKEEFSGGEWCPHIHVAYSRNMDVYGAEACLFIQEDYTNLTEDRHIRAMIQGPNKMCKVEPNLYMENFEYLVRSVRYYVKVIASEISKSKCICKDAKQCIHCDACWCRYSCTCEDYWYDRQVCEHIHNVAMQERKEEISLEEQFSFQHFIKSDIIYREKPNFMHKAREQFMMSEHELSYHIPFKYVEEIEKGHTWRLASARDRRVATVSVNKQWESSCICRKPSTTKGHMCVLCNICAYHYICDCIYAEEVLVCRHMHAVARFRGLEPTNQDNYLNSKVEYYGKMIEEFEKKLRDTAKMPTRKPTGLSRSCSENPTLTPSSTSSYTSC